MNLPIPAKFHPYSAIDRGPQFYFAPVRSRSPHFAGTPGGRATKKAFPIQKEGSGLRLMYSDGLLPATLIQMP